MTAGPADQEEFDRAHALWKGGRHAEAALLLEDLTQRHSDNAGLFSALGVCRFEAGAYGPARLALERALALDPDQGIAAYNLAHLLLLEGDEERGFQLYERRWASFQRPSWHPSSDLAWDGQALDGTLLVLAEQGFGDMIQFARFLPLATRRCRRLLLAVPPELKRLLAGVDGVAEVIVSGQALPAFNRFVMMTSLPYRLRAFGQDRPQPPYLPLPAPMALPGSGFKVGLVWAGRAAHAEDRLRSLTPEHLAPLLAVEEVDFFSLQLGQGAAPAGMTDLAPHLGDFMDTAAALAGLDLLISADSAPAHLAGALGRPVWTFVTYVPDWRWGLGLCESAWYPSMRLLRQESPGDWGAPIVKAAQNLEKLIHP
ncbi:MAG: tetratricopeptide repeat protein [Rhodospirillales bacterium]|nr:tetratricopeptide repeat protein [Rhodospirillales bacterium]